MIAVVEYRHSGIAPFPAQAIDTRNAIRYMKLHAKEYKTDVNQMFVAGDSSGGHTAFFSQLIREDGNVNIYLRETADMNIYPDVDASVKGIISLYGALSVMLEGADHSGSEFFSDNVLDIIEEFLQKIISAC